MTVGETLLKITDYPFSFSITFLLLRADGIKDIFSEQTAIFLLIAGFAGTALTILDPIGKIMKYYFLWIAKISYLDPEKLSPFEKEVAKCSLRIGERLMNSLRKIRKNDYDIAPNDFTKISWAYIHSAFHTSAIELEKDKIVSTYYFLMTLYIATLVITYSGIFTDNYPDSFKNNVLCNVDCAKSATLVSINVIALCVVMVLIINGNKFFNKILIVATYLFSVGSKEVPHESTESVYQFIEIGDWQTAEYWRRQIQDDLRYKRGMRDLIIKSTETVYEPLYKEFLRLEGVFQLTELQKSYSTLGFGAWNAIKEGLLHLSVTDSEFVKLADSFQKECNRYENFLERAPREATEIILKHISSTYNENVTNAVYTVGGPTWVRNMELEHLGRNAIFGVSPEYPNVRCIPKHLKLTIKDQSGNISTKDITIPTELDKLSTVWNTIIDETHNQENVKQLKETYLKISEDMKILKEMCEKQNKLKYDVF